MYSASSLMFKVSILFHDANIFCRFYDVTVDFIHLLHTNSDIFLNVSDGIILDANLCFSYDHF